MLLQVLRVRDAPGAHPRARGGRRRLDEAERRNAKELLVLTGERPEVNAEVAARLAEWGHEDFTSYVVWACERALERGILPHTNLGVLGHEDLARLREVTASQGLMLESVSERLMETVHAGSPTKHPAKRLATIEAAGELRIPFTSGILVGIGETEEERVESLEALARSHERHGHLQEVILQNFVPHPRYYGREVADIADQAARERWAEAGPPGANLEAPGRGPGLRAARGELSSQLGDRGHRSGLIRECKRLMPDVGVQVPPNLSDWWAELVEAGATDLGGLSANGDHISPEHAFPSPASGAQGAGAEGVCADRAALRLPAVHGPRVDGAGGPRRDQAQVLELHPAARVRAAERGEPRRRRWPRRRSPRGARGRS